MSYFWRERIGVNHSRCPVAVRSTILGPKCEGTGAEPNGHIVELQPRDAQYNRVVTKLCDEDRWVLARWVMSLEDIGRPSMTSRLLGYWSGVRGNW